MKKLIIIVVIILTIHAVYAQELSKINQPAGASEMSLRANGNTFLLRTSGGGVSLVINFEGKLNGKSIEFKQSGPMGVSMNDGKMSDEEIHLVGSSIDIMKSVLKRDKAELSWTSFILKGEGKTLQVDIKSGDAVFEGKMEGTINGNPFEFKSGAGGSIVVNNGELSDSEIKGIESGFNIMKNNLAKR